MLLSKESSKCPTGSEALNPARLKGASVKLASKREDLQKKDFFLSGIAQITSTIITIPMAITVTIADIGSNIGPHSLTVAAMEREVNIVIIIIIITSSSSIGIIIRENSSLQFLPLSFALALAL